MCHPEARRSLAQMCFLFLFVWRVGGKGNQPFQDRRPLGLDWTAGADAPILKRLIPVNTFVSPWGPKIIGSDVRFVFVCLLGWWGKSNQPFQNRRPLGLDWTAGADAPILKRLIAVNTFVSPWGLRSLAQICFCCFVLLGVVCVCVVFPHRQ